MFFFRWIWQHPAKKNVRELKCFGNIRRVLREFLKNNRYSTQSTLFFPCTVVKSSEKNEGVFEQPPEKCRNNIKGIDNSQETMHQMPEITLLRTQSFIIYQTCGDMSPKFTSSFAMSIHLQELRRPNT